MHLATYLIVNSGLTVRDACQPVSQSTPLFARRWFRFETFLPAPLEPPISQKFCLRMAFQYLRRRSVIPSWVVRGWLEDFSELLLCVGVANVVLPGDEA